MSFLPSIILIFAIESINHTPHYKPSKFNSIIIMVWGSSSLCSIEFICFLILVGRGLKDSRAILSWPQVEDLPPMKLHKMRRGELESNLSFRVFCFCNKVCALSKIEGRINLSRKRLNHIISHFFKMSNSNLENKPILTNYRLNTSL